MKWPWTRRAPAPPASPWPPVMAHPTDAGADEAESERDAADDSVFVCSTCGRTDLPEAGDWDPPICLECDAAINFDAQEEEAWFGH
jgi:hypothetical protein